MRPRRKALFTRGAANAKTRKGLKLADVDTLILHLAPADSAGGATVCASATPECIRLCLNTAGRGGIFAKGKRTNAILQARKRRTREYFADPAGFVDRLSGEIELAKRRGRAFVVRVNGTSDLPKVAMEL